MRLQVDLPADENIIITYFGKYFEKNVKVDIYWQKVILSYTTDLLRCVAQFFYAGKEVNALADYAFRSYEERQKIQEMVEAGLSAKDIAASLGISPSAVYAELRRGRDGTRLPDKRLGYNAELAQLSVQQGLERRGRRTAGA